MAASTKKRAARVASGDAPRLALVPAPVVAPVMAPVPAPVLALDYGRKRIGLAVSDALGVLPRPIETLVRKNRRDDIKRLREIARENGARLLVVGHPLRLDGTRGEMADEVARFAKRLQSQLGLPVELMDERLTSWEAEQLEDQFAGPLAATLSREGEKHGMDSVAAAIILRDYLEQPRNPGHNSRTKATPEAPTKATPKGSPRT